MPAPTTPGWYPHPGASHQRLYWTGDRWAGEPAPGDTPFDAAPPQPPLATAPVSNDAATAENPYRLTLGLIGIGGLVIGLLLRLVHWGTEDVTIAVTTEQWSTPLLTLGILSSFLWITVRAIQHRR